ncbi:class I SAM-dependent methyltransferase [Dactylosporangium sp. AC04546]|uniref:O-methyltransferase n=1 Tax=Dactylosporangium sp. AC04546 TaxID=2862460 RepID=UPI001EDD4830|nr:class I SAM-dependent methyltransferase [Dactylosporangium sp. AC04546]WVK81908.1 class I SAM-dependent methyltransferase [Dactylosporangium sp. AC04546]
MTLVDEAYVRAGAHGFELSCEVPVGRLLAALAAALPPGARVLELGSGAGVGTAWLAQGLLPRTDVTLTSVELDPATAAVAAKGDWPPFVDLRVADAVEFLRAAGHGYDLIFADCRGGKTQGLDHTIARLNPRGTLVVDDMTEVDGWPADFKAAQRGVRRTLVEHPDLVTAELDFASGVVVSVRR